MDEATIHQLRNVISKTKDIMHLYLEVFEGWVEQTKAVDKIVPYNVENVVSDIVEECPQEETVAVNTVEKENLYEFGRLADKTLSDGEESNEGWSEDEFTHGKKASDIFYGTPPILDCPDPIVEPRPFHSLGPNDDMFVRQTLKATREKFQFKTKHSNKNRYEVYCEIDNCSWPMSTILHEIMGKTRSKIWRPNEISRDLNALLEINRHNPGTVAYILTDSEYCFESCFYAIGSTIRAFKRFCRKVIIMDGAHLKGDFKGTILHAVAMDGNNQIVPLVHGICNKREWSYMDMLYECVGDCQELTFVTDRADEIRVSIENVFPHAHLGVCAFHLLGNIVHRFGKNDKTKVLFWRLVKAYKRNVFEELWSRFSSTRAQLAAYLSEIPCAKWTRTYSPSKRYDYMTLNSVESMNALSVDARKMPIIPLLECFRHLSHEWYNKRRIDGGKRSTVLTEWAEKVVTKNEERTTRWFVSSVSDVIYQVHDFKHGGIVDLRQETCTCKYCEGTRLPCGHVIMVLKHLKKTNFGQLAIDAYKMEMYQSTYEEPVYPLLEPCDLEITVETMIIKPLIMDTCDIPKISARKDRFHLCFLK
uniref:SWIM-type domain-containing protein n=1 Tax=Lactuca sativa TaxID=4236 RepID=A0A9R1W5M1_LACSA|nr:hypothetical protein LSAT_V11C300114420 [Lactuca sativa]